MLVVGVALLAAGLLGFVDNPIVSQREDALFHVDTLHNVIHIVTGLIALFIGASLRGRNLARRPSRSASRTSSCSSRRSSRPTCSACSMPVNTADHGLHLVLSVGSIAAGLASTAARHRLTPATAACTRVPCPGAGAPPASPRQRPERAVGRGVAVLHEVGLDNGLPLGVGHKRRKAHGANKPPRLMARLIEFFTKSGELVLDPFAGVGGTLLGAAIARGPRRAIGLELDERWIAIYRETVEALASERDGAGPALADLGPQDPGGVRGFDPSGLEMRHGDARTLLGAMPDASVDLVATDPRTTSSCR